MSKLNKFSLKDDVKKMVAIGEFQLDPEARVLVDALDDAEMVGGDDGVKEQILHITSALVPVSDEQEDIVNRLTSIAYDKPYVMEKQAVQTYEEERPVDFAPSVAYPMAGPTVFSRSAVFAADPEFDNDLVRVQSFEKQLKSKLGEIKKEEKKSGLIDDVLGAIDTVYRDPAPMDPDTRDERTRTAVYDLLDKRLKGDRIIGGKK